MAEDLYDGEFWLPPQFLTDDDVLMDCPTTTNRTKAYDCFGPNSDQSSPVESMLGSTETESDEDDFIAGLTRKMAHSSLHHDSWKVDSGSLYDNPKTWGMDGSPQSTLCGVLGGCGCKQGSSRGSTNCSSQVSSPPSAAGMNRTDVAWDLLYAAAGEVAKMGVAEERASYYQNRGFFGGPQKPRPVPVPLKNPNTNIGFHSSRSLPYHQLQAIQFEQLKQQQMMKQQSLAAGWGQQKPIAQYQQNQTHRIIQNRASNTSVGPIGLSPTAWPTLQQSQSQQQPGSGMRAVFLGNPGSKRECAGTGVFLPRRIGTPAETRKKPGCSTVLVPDRVVKALNLKLESIDSHSPPQLPPANFSSEYDDAAAAAAAAAALKYRNNAVPMPQQRRNNRRPQPVIDKEVRLPQEWTY